MKLFTYFLTAICITLFICSCSTTIYLVRHAEKQNSTDTSTLTVSGQQRAVALCDSLVHKRIVSIYASKYVRTQLTAQPLASALHESIVIYNIDSAEIFATQLKNLKRKNVLVVGHTSNIPKLINYISGDTVQIPENDFDNLFVIKTHRFIKTKIVFVQKTYGVVSPQ